MSSFEYDEKINEERNWILDGDGGTLNLEPGDEALTPNWINGKMEMRTSFFSKLKSTLLMFFYFGIFAWLSYFNADPGVVPLDEALQAFFLPVLGYVLICYRSLDKFIKSGISILAIFILYRILLLEGLITFRGITFIRYLLWLLDNIGFGTAFFSSYSSIEIANFSLKLMVALMMFEFLLLAIYVMINKPDKIFYALSKESLFLRVKTKSSIFTILKLVAYIGINPFNISNYHEISIQIKYYKMSKRESKKWDYAKISLPAIKKYKKNKQSSTKMILTGLLMVLLGIIIMPLLIIGIIIILRTFLNKKSYCVSIDLYRNKVEGSWILSNTVTSIKLKGLTEEEYKYFPSL